MVRGAVAVTAVVGIVVILGASPASAHAELLSSSPPQSSVLLSPPRQVVLRFDEPVEIDFGSIRVLDLGGRRVDEGGTRHPAGDGRAVGIALPGRLPDGTYVVAWRVVSDDGHPVHGAYVFSVGAARSTGRAKALAFAIGSARGSSTVGVVFGVVRFVLYAGLLVLVGGATVLVALVPSARTTKRMRRILWWSWTAALVASLASVAVQGVYAASLPLGHVLTPSLWNEVAHTRFGEVQLLRVVLLCAAVPVVLGLQGRIGRSLTAWVAPGIALGSALLVTPGLSGHAATIGDPSVGIPFDAVHMAGAAVWIGGLVVVGALFFPRALDVPGTPPEHQPSGLDVARRFSAFAAGALVAVVASGVVQSIRQVGSVYAFVHTVYGRTLTVKVSLVALLVLLGAMSHRSAVGRWMPALPGRVREGAGSGVPGTTRLRPNALRRSVAAKFLVAAAVVVCTALLVNALPAKQAASEPFATSFEVLGDQVNVVIGPARVGPGNQLHVYVLGPLGQPVGIPEVDASISLPSAGIGPTAIPLVVASPGHYQASDVDIPQGGGWTLTLTVRTTTTDERVVHSSFPVH